MAKQEVSPPKREAGQAPCGIPAEEAVVPRLWNVPASVLLLESRSRNKSRACAQRNCQVCRSEENSDILYYRSKAEPEMQGEIWKMTFRSIFIPSLKESTPWNPLISGVFSGIQELHRSHHSWRNPLPWTTFVQKFPHSSDILPSGQPA